MKRWGVELIVAAALVTSIWSSERLTALAQPAPNDPAQLDAGLDAPTTTSDAASTPEVDELRPPTSPAFSLLGISPSEIDRPRTPSALATSLGSAVGRSLPSGLAIEVSPFWLFDQSNLTLDKVKKWPWQLLSSFSIGAGTSKTTGTTMAGEIETTDFALGGHVVWLRGWRTCNATAEPLNQGAFAEARLGIEAAAKKVLELCEQLARAEIAACSSDPNQQTCEAAARDKLARCDREAETDAMEKLDALTKSMAESQIALDEELLEQVQKCEKVIWTPHGLVGSAAAAVALRFDGSEWKNGEYLRSAAWITFGYEGDPGTLLAVVRLRWENVNGNGADVWAGGLRAVLHRKSFGASVEGVYNVGSDDLDSGWRLALVGEAKIGDSWLTLSAGKDYDSLGGDAFFSLANLTVTMGDPTIAQGK